METPKLFASSLTEALLPSSTLINQQSNAPELILQLSGKPCAAK